MLVQFHGGPLHGVRRDVRESADAQGVLTVTVLNLARAIEDGAAALERTGASELAASCRSHARRLPQPLLTARYKRRLAGKDGVWVFYHVEGGA